jgi:YVTN family beta-propeller protein
VVLLLSLAAVSVLPLGVTHADTVVAIIPLGGGAGHSAVNPTTNKVYVTTPATIAVIDGATNTVTGVIPGGYFYDIKVNPSTDLIYVTDYARNSVSVIDGGTNAYVRNITGISQPWGIGLNPVTNMIYVAGYGNGNSVYVINGTTNAVVQKIRFAGNEIPHEPAVNPKTGMIYVGVTCSFCPQYSYVAAINGSTYAVVAKIYGVGDSPGWSDLNPITNMIYVDNGNGIAVINGSTNTLVTTLTIPGCDVAVNPNTDKVYITNCQDNSVYVVDGSTNGVVDKIPVGRGPGGVSVNPSTDKVYVSIGYDNDEVYVIDGSSSSTSAPATSRLTIGSQATNGTALTGFYTVLSHNGAALASGHTPATFTLNDSQTYAITVDNYGHYAFSYWLDTGSKSSTRAISITQNTTVTAVYAPVQDPTQTSVSCQLTTSLAGTMTCTATVTDTASDPLTPTGSVAFTGSSVAGTSSIGSCTLSSASASAASCTIQFTPTASGSFTVTATYGGNYFHLPSAGNQTLTCAGLACA